MAGKRTARPARRIAKRVVRRRAVARTGTATRRMNIPRAVAAGARTLIGSIPGIGPILAGIADFAFKAVGITKEVALSGAIRDKEVELFGLGAEILVPVAKIWRGSEYATPATEDSGLKTTYNSPFDAVHVMDIEFKMIPSSKVGDRQGEWSMCFTPFTSTYSLTDYKVLSQDAHVPVYNAICRKPGAVYGPASRPLTLTYSTRGNTYLSMFHPEQVMLGVLQVAYQDTLRDRYVAFTATEVAPEIIITGHIRPGPFARRGNNPVDTDIFDNCAKTGAGLFNSTGKIKYRIQKEGFACVDNGQNCKVTGTIMSESSDFEMLEVRNAVPRT